MGTNDGTVQGLTTLLNNGSNAQRHNIVLVAEGFRASEQDAFNDLCDDFVTALQAETWFPVLGGAINVHRLNVASDESGADDPANCGDGSSGSGASPDTYFDATFCVSGIRRCLSGDVPLVRTTLDAQLPQWHSASVLVNTSERGGCATGNVFFTAISSDWLEVVLHELGHASFDLADEYQTWEGCDSGETGQDNAPAGEPPEPNITAETDREDLKWNLFLDPTVPVPTMENPDCSQCDERPNVLADDLAIGLYEGAGYYHCGYYRPAYECKMRNSSRPFCRVCVDGIAEVLASFQDGEPDVDVVPASLDFGEVAFGLTMYRAFEVRILGTGAPIPVDITLGAVTGDADFSYAPDTELSFHLPVPVFEPYLARKVFVAFHSVEDADLTATGALQVDSADTTDLPQTVDLLGEAKAPLPLDSVLVLDRSDSMDGATGVPGKEKIDLAIDAGHLYVSLLKDNDRVGVVRYNDQAADPADVLLGMTLSDAAGKAQATAAIDRTHLAPAGFTSIGGGIVLGSSVLDNGSADNRALLVLTDGIQNTPPDIPTATATVQSKAPRQRVFAVGLGLNQLEDRLQEIASVTHGYAAITGNLVAEREFLLHKLYTQILSDAGDEAFVKDPVMVLPPGQQRSTPISLGEVDVSADFIVVFRGSGVFPKYMKVWLEAPDGSLFHPSDAASTPSLTYVQEPGHLYFRWLFPAFPDRPLFHAGRWRLWVENRGVRIDIDSADGLPGNHLFYAVMCKARSDLRLAGRVDQTSYDPGSPLTVILQPTLFGLPVDILEPVRVEVTRPDGVATPLTLSRHEDGSYRGVFSDTAQVGVYPVETEVTAETPQGHRVTRYRYMTGVIFRPGRGDTGGGGPGGGGTGGGGPQGGDGGVGILVDHLRRCCKAVVERLDRIARLLEETGRRGD